MPIRTILDRMRHDGCGGRAGRAELITGVEAASGRPVRRIVLWVGRAASNRDGHTVLHDPVAAAD